MNDQYYMDFAIDLAKRVSGQTSPNPVVGAVIVKHGEIVGFGAHLKAGEAHAEVQAIKMAGLEKTSGATVYVTLEPCSHFGKTPPCSNLLIESRVKRVVIASVDPNPLVAGEGIKKLQDAGIETVVGVCQEKALALNEVFFHYIKTNTPFVTLKTAASLDGKTATYSGESKWITGPDARLDVHHYRHKHDAILVGVETVIKDNPSLTTRLPSGGKNPIRVILDTSLRIPIHSNVLTDGQADTWIITGCNPDNEKLKVLKEHNSVQIHSLPTETINVNEMLNLLGELGVTSLFVEGGATVNGSFLKANAMNQVITYLAPKLIGGKEAPTMIAGKGFETMSEVLNLEVKEFSKIGEDLKIVSVPKKGEE
ncbi:Riboflavin biosynthesis protein RibD [Bacillus sp. THAF10]|uniref:bifunctional diaminohydroxyphosphoribosylaminopyrimidine deaminase/5-amino-6-(5-phosphoribosylamino)uracil reductase RibD n=1 Tax=Bacillus sp. THAF10 TaxID=2587848 RepID=UPI0012691A17|nr:bifunctional diaminohydroxyphosphoribosylaminopyrimidine deaminase/5-amino-6-(5-phosphoribosylamino)uracil reductase RibD [Bacillus sp. THAF10]QFT89469.1 Riboflavin biosynthesis protein RibD [Bacillus sp. THAF10]